jgi:hypothetical protein
MPAKNPRLSVVLSPALAATLAAVSEEAGESASSLVRGLLEQAQPALERMLELLRAAKGAKGQIGSGVADSLNRVVTDLEDAMAVADRMQSQVINDLVSQAEAVKGRRRRGSDARPAGRAAAPSPALSTPVPVTRGSGPQKRPSAALKAAGAEGVSKGVKRGRV